MKTVSRMVLVAAATSLAVLPVAAEANTRASSKGSVAAMSAPGKGRASKGQRQAEGGFPIAVGVGAASLVVGAVVVASSGDDNGQSPGT